jgi:2-keto-3-deoxy-L-rhamnonate aldolase RhmA
MVGALDLSGSMGLLGQTGHASVEGAVQKVLAACRKAGVPCGIITTDPDTANRRIREGFTNIILGIDILTLLGGAKEALGRIAR